MDGRESNSSFYHIIPLYFFTLSSLFCQLSSRLTINSMQWDKVERIPAVVALKVMASPLKSIPFIPLGLAGGNTGTDGDKEWALSTCQIEIWISGYKRRTINEQVFYQIQIKKKKKKDICRLTHIFLCCRCCCDCVLHLSWGPSEIHLHLPLLLVQITKQKQQKTNLDSSYGQLV